jgi:hypothetical protein
MDKEKTITLYTMSWNGYWNKYNKNWCSYINLLNTKPDEIIIVSDKSIDMSLLNYKNVKNIVVPIVDGKRTMSEYRNAAIKESTCDWIVPADLDDSFPAWFLENIPNDSDIHAFSFYDKVANKYHYPDSNCLNDRLYSKNSDNLISGIAAIKKYVFDNIKYENECYEDRIFYAMASKLNLKVSYDQYKSNPRFYYSGFHTNNKELDRVTNIYIDALINDKGPVYTFWFSDNMSENRLKALNILNSSCNDLHLINYEEFYKFENSEIKIHEGFKYLTDNHKSDYARAYMMYFYGGGYSDVKGNKFSWDKYFNKLFYSKYDAIGYTEKYSNDIAKFYNDINIKQYIDKHYNKFIGNGHYIFKPKTYIAYKWITELNLLIDEKYNELIKNPGLGGYNQSVGYPFEWNELGGRILHKLQYEHNFSNIMHGMPYTNNINYK